MPYLKRYKKRMPYRKPVRKYKKKQPRRVARKTKSWVNPPMKVNQTLQYVFRSDDAYRKYFAPATRKNGSLSVDYQTSDSTAVTLSNLIATDNRLVELFGNFRWFRIQAVRVQLIPEKWDASTLITSGGSFEAGEKPRVHFINDEGSTLISNGGVSQISIADAETYGAKYKTSNFEKNFTFWLKPYHKELNTTSSDSYNTMNIWTTTLNPSTVLENRLPPGNLFFGFSDVPANFKYRTIVDYYFVFKEPKMVGS